MKKVMMFLSIFVVLSMYLTSLGFSQELEVIRGKITCIGCALKKEQAAKANCSVYGHTHGLRPSDDEDEIWSFLENDNSKDLIHNHDYDGAEVEIVGRELEDTQIIEVESFKIIPKKMAPEASTHMAPESSSY